MINLPATAVLVSVEPSCKTVPVPLQVAEPSMFLAMTLTSISSESFGLTIAPYFTAFT